MERWQLSNLSKYEKLLKVFVSIHSLNIDAKNSGQSDKAFASSNLNMSPVLEFVVLHLADGDHCVDLAV